MSTNGDEMLDGFSIITLEDIRKQSRSNAKYCSMDGPGWRVHNIKQQTARENMARLRALRLGATQ